MLVLVMSFAHGLSDPVNTSIDELNGFTSVDTPLEFAQETNTATNGMMGLFTLIALGLVSFLLSLLFIKDYISAFAVTFFFLSIIALFMRIIDLIKDNVFWGVVAMLLIAVAVAYVNKR